MSQRSREITLVAQPLLELLDMVRPEDSMASVVKVKSKRNEVVSVEQNHLHAIHLIMLSL